MKISTILDQIDLGTMALPKFQRGYVWNREQVRGLMNSLYRKFPIGSLLVWVMQSNEELTRGNGPITLGVVNLLLDGQQRITSLYGIVRGKVPIFFDGDEKIITGLHFKKQTCSKTSRWKKGRTLGNTREFNEKTKVIGGDLKL